MDDPRICFGETPPSYILDDDDLLQLEDEAAHRQLPQTLHVQGLGWPNMIKNNNTQATVHGHGHGVIGASTTQQADSTFLGSANYCNSVPPQTHYSNPKATLHGQRPEGRTINACYDYSKSALTASFHIVEDGVVKIVTVDGDIMRKQPAQVVIGGRATQLADPKFLAANYYIWPSPETHPKKEIGSIIEGYDYSQEMKASFDIVEDGVVKIVTIDGDTMTKQPLANYVTGGYCAN